MTSQSPNYDSSFDKVLHKRSDLHLARKLWHVSTGGVALFLFWNSTESNFFWGMIGLSISATGFVFDIVRNRVPAFNHIVLKFASPIMRRSERDGWSGLPFYALGAALSLFFFSRQIAFLSIMFLVIADPIASFFGVLYGKDKILPNKSLQGAVAGFFTCYLLSLFYVMNSTTLGLNILIFSLIAGLIGSLSELVSAFNVDDNLTVPVLSGLGLTILNHFVTVFP